MFGWVHLDMDAPFFVMSFNPIHGVKSPGQVEQNFGSYFTGTDSDATDLAGFFDFGGDWLTAQWNNFSGITAQQELQSNAQEFQEYMYQQYNSPQALKRQFEEAGLNTNLLGSTSFGTAQGSSGAPAVNAPASVASDVANAVTQGASNLSDVPLKGSQSDYYSSYPSLNKALENKYGVEAKLSDIEYKFLSDTYEWRLENEEFNARTIRENYYYAVQRVKTAEQEYQNLVKEGQILEHDITYHEYLAKVQKEIYEYWALHKMPPSPDWQNKFWDNYIYDGKNIPREEAFNRYMRGFRTMEDQRNKSAVDTGAISGTLEAFGVKISTTAIEYGLSKGKKLWEIIKDAQESSDSDVDSPADKFGVNPDSSTSEGKFFIDKMHEIDDEVREMWKNNPDMDSKDEDKILIERGYPLELVYKYRQWLKYGRKGE